MGENRLTGLIYSVYFRDVREHLPSRIFFVRSRGRPLSLNDPEPLISSLLKPKKVPASSVSIRFVDFSPDILMRSNCIT